MRGGIMRSRQHPIAAMFARLGAQGVFVDPTAHRTVWADTAGTLHPALGGVVGQLTPMTHSPVSEAFVGTGGAVWPVLRADGVEFNAGVGNTGLRAPDNADLRFGTTSFTVAFAGYVDAVTGTKTIFNKRPSAGGAGWNFGLYDGNGRLRIVLNDGTTQILGYGQPIGGWPATQWVNAIVEIDRSAAQARTYIDNVFQSANVLSLGALGDISSTATVDIGSAGNTLMWGGKISRVMALNKLLSARDRELVNIWLNDGHS